MWGQGILIVWSYAPTGIIPTRVGTREKGKNTLFVIKDHPHACGDKIIIELKVSTIIGSSPRVWGQGLKHMKIWRVAGIIPTRVGTRFTELSAKIDREDHPHACGDKVTDTDSTRTDNGSSPRVWGQVYAGAYLLPQTRIIPTRVGTSILVVRISPSTKDHPHACGDKMIITTN